MAKANPLQATRQMSPAEYLQILFDDCGFNREQRNAYVSAEVGREIHALDELGWKEISKLISMLKATKTVRKALVRGQQRVLSAALIAEWRSSK